MREHLDVFKRKFYMKPSIAVNYPAYYDCFQSKKTSKPSLKNLFKFSSFERLHTSFYSIFLRLCFFLKNSVSHNWSLKNIIKTKLTEKICVSNRFNLSKDYYNLLQFLNLFNTILLGSTISATVYFRNYKVGINDFSSFYSIHLIFKYRKFFSSLVYKEIINTLLGYFPSYKKTKNPNNSQRFLIIKHTFAKALEHKRIRATIRERYYRVDSFKLRLLDLDYFTIKIKQLEEKLRRKKKQFMRRIPFEKKKFLWYPHVPYKKSNNFLNRLRFSKFFHILNNSGESYHRRNLRIGHTELSILPTRLKLFEYMNQYWFTQFYRKKHYHNVDLASYYIINKSCSLFHMYKKFSSFFFKQHMNYKVAYLESHKNILKSCGLMRFLLHSNRHNPNQLSRKRSFLKRKFRLRLFLKEMHYINELTESTWVNLNKFSVEFYKQNHQETLNITKQIKKHGNAAVFIKILAKSIAGKNLILRHRPCFFHNFWTCLHIYDKRHLLFKTSYYTMLRYRWRHSFFHFKNSHIRLFNSVFFWYKRYPIRFNKFRLNFFSKRVHNYIKFDKSTKPCWIPLRASYKKRFLFKKLSKRARISNSNKYNRLRLITKLFLRNKKKVFHKLYKSKRRHLNIYSSFLSFFFFEEFRLLYKRISYSLRNRLMYGKLQKFCKYSIFVNFIKRYYLFLCNFIRFPKKFLHYYKNRRLKKKKYYFFKYARFKKRKHHFKKRKHRFIKWKHRFKTRQHAYNRKSNKLSLKKLSRFRKTRWGKRSVVLIKYGVKHDVFKQRRFLSDFRAIRFFFLKKTNWHLTSLKWVILYFLKQTTQNSFYVSHFISGNISFKKKFYAKLFKDGLNFFLEPSALHNNLLYDCFFFYKGSTFFKTLLIQVFFNCQSTIKTNFNLSSSLNNFFFLHFLLKYFWFLLSKRKYITYLFSYIAGLLRKKLNSYLFLINTNLNFFEYNTHAQYYRGSAFKCSPVFYKVLMFF